MVSNEMGSYISSYWRYKILKKHYHRGSNMQEKKECMIKIMSFSFLKKTMTKKMLTSLYAMVMAVCFTLPAYSKTPKESITPATQPPEQKVEQVSIRPDGYNTGLIYSIQKDNCTIEWITRNNEPDIIKNWSQCPASLSEQLPLMKQLCSSYLSKDKNANALRAFFWGRLLPDEMPGPPELSMRLALAAHKSTGWDAKRGRAKNGDDYGLVKNLANSAMIYPELTKLFERFNKSIKLSCVEKLCIMKAKDLPFFEQLKQQGVKAEEKLPFDFVAWFTITAVSQN